MLWCIFCICCVLFHIMAKIVLEDWTPVLGWCYNTFADECAICRDNLLNECSECAGNSVDNKNCVVVKGNCGHCFHNHCISRWLASKSSCPLCVEKFVIAVKDMNELRKQ